MKPWPADAVLVDSSVWIDHFRNRDTPAAVLLARWLAEEPDRVVVNHIVSCELLRGMRSEAAAATLQAHLDRLPQADAITDADWLASAAIYRRCRGAGLTIRSPMDCLIAAQAMRLKLPLLAIDRDFHAIAALHTLVLHATTTH